MRRRARVLAAPSRVLVAALVVALALAAALAGGGGYANPVYAQTTVDYDDDNDGLIDVRNLAQLNAMHFDPDGNGAVPSGASETQYNTAFPNRATAANARMGCPVGNCSGYELRANLDFDTDDDGSTYTGTGAAAASDSGDAYHDSGGGWRPIGTQSNPYSAAFKGNGFIISNLFIKRTTTSRVGLFGEIDGSARIESVSLKNAYVNGQRYVGALVGVNRGTVTASWSDGAVRGERIVGGLIGHNLHGGPTSSDTADVIACYSRASAYANPPAGQQAWVGGLIGVSENNASARIIASYSTGAVTSTSSASVAGFAVISGAVTVTESYWDLNTSGIADDGDTNMPEGKTTVKLKSVTSYTDIYANWNANVDGATGNDDPWDFGTADDYPVLKYGGMDPRYQRIGGDYDLDDDGLIEISTLAQLNAVRWDLDGDAVKDTTSDADWKKYGAAFPLRDRASATSMGCPSGTCSGYELAAHLDFDTDGDGATYTGTGATATGDGGDDYNNSGNGWEPLGTNASRFAATFKGNGFIISNLFIKRASASYMGLFGATSGPARIESMGLKNAYVNGDSHVGALVGENRGTVAASWSDGAVRGGISVGGLVGRNRHRGSTSDDTALITACYSHASVYALGSSSTAYAGGLVGIMFPSAGGSATIDASYSTGAVTSAVTSEVNGFASSGGTITNSYWDLTTSGIADDSGNASPEGVTTDVLQNPIDYTGVFANWNVNVDGVAGVDDPWHFGYDGEYPVLKFGGMDHVLQRGDYDRDDDGLIEIYNLDQLNAVRWDEDGDAVQDMTTADNWKKYGAAFPFAVASLGCPDTDDADSDPGPCGGYELVHDLDFDTDGDGDVDSDDDYPSWSRIARLETTFDGNGNSISNMKISGAEGMQEQVGLFGIVARASTKIVSLGVRNADITAGGSVTMVGALAAAVTTGAEVRASYATGTITISGAAGSVSAGGLAGYIVSGDFYACWADVDISSNATGNYGGLLGRLLGTDLQVRASYALGDVSVSGNNAITGGLSGTAQSVEITQTYAAGAVSNTGTGPSRRIGGLAGGIFGADNDFSDSYWDATTTGQADDNDNDFPEGRATSDLQSVLKYTGIYNDWNADVDGVASNDDDPWDFGAASEYPALKYGGMDVYYQRGDYDRDDDGLIEITALDQLNAIRWDLDGDAVQDSASDADWRAWSAAFPRGIASLGCPDTDDADMDPGPCLGYELAAHLDFDADADGDVDEYDPYPNWTPIGDGTNRFDAEFDGNGYTISNLRVEAAGGDAGLFGATAQNASVIRVGLPNAEVTVASASGTTYAGALVGFHAGVIREAYATGSVSQTGSGSGGSYGGLIGSAAATGEAYASWTDVDVSSVANMARTGGFVGEMSSGSAIRGAHSAGAVSSTGDGANTAGFAGTQFGAASSIYVTGAATQTGTGGTVGPFTAAFFTSSAPVETYWDTTATGVADDANSSMPEGKTTEELQEVLTYAGIFAGWRDNVDGVAGDDDVWDFGAPDEYPALKFGVMKPYTQRGDYDRDDDGLIEITTLDQLNAMRWDLDGDAVQDSTSGADWKKYNLAFANADASLGCPDTNDADSDPGPCIGYELAANLDFDTDGDGDVDSGDAYPNWQSVGRSADNFATHFAGNGRTISNLTINGPAQNLGLFGYIASGPSSTITGLGLLDADIRGTRSGNNAAGGALAGTVTGATGAIRSVFATGGVSHVGTGNYNTAGGLIGNFGSGTITASWADVDVSLASPSGNAGGLVGFMGGTARATYALGSATTTGNNAYAGGLVGAIDEGAIDASYAAGSVTISGTGGARGGLVGSVSSSTITASYWDLTTTGVPDDANTASPEGVNTAGLQSVLDYTGVYADWDVNVDGVSGNDSPWDFGTASEYPALKFGGMDTYIQRGDYDRDDDGLIEITTLAQLNAVRWDLDGDAVQDSTSAADWKAYSAAFPNADASLGCPDTADPGSDPGPCTGFELAANLDFDADGDGDVDSYDGFPNWQPIGSATSAFSATFDGGNHKIANMKIYAAGSGASIGLFANSSGTVMKTGLPNALVSATGGNANTHIGALLGEQSGFARGNWATGTVTQTGGSGGGDVGGLIGSSTAGSVTASWSGVHVTTSAGGANAGGLIGKMSGSLLSSTYSTGVVTTSGSGAFAGGLAGQLTSLSALRYSYVTGPATKTGGGGQANALAGRGFATTSDNVYWDTGTTGFAAGSALGLRGYGTMALSMPEAYGTGIYANWNANVDGVTGVDDPWDFGRNMQYPMLKWGGMSLVQQGSLAMGMGGYGDTPKVGQNANVCLVDGPAMRASGTHNGKDPWQWQRSPDGKTWTDITYDPAVVSGGRTWRYVPVAADVNNYLRACAALNDTAPEGMTEACVRMFAKTVN